MPTLSQARAALARLDERHEQYYATLLDPFTRTITEQVVRSIAALTVRLTQTLAFDQKGRIALTFQNRHILSGVDTQFEELLDHAGYQQSVATLVGQFPGQLPFLRDELDILNSIVKTPYVSGPLLTDLDLDALHVQQQLTRANLLDVAATVGDLAKRKILLSVNGLGHEEMTRLLSLSLHRTPGEAGTIAATSASMFYRTAYSRVVQTIESSGRTGLRYTYDGPRDQLNRPFCRHVIDQARAGETWTRRDIDQLDNKQGIPVWIGGGGYNCRHQWRLALPEDSD